MPDRTIPKALGVFERRRLGIAGARLGMMAPRSFTTLETVFLETPGTLAKSVKEIERRSKW